MKQIQAVYKVKSVGPPEYYLGSNFKRDSKRCWSMGCKKYITEAVSHVERIFGHLVKHDTPMVAGDHPELNDAKVLDDWDHQQYQMIIGMLNWITTLGRLDIAYARKLNQRITIDSKDPGVVKNGADGHLEVDLSKKLKEHYPGAKEVIDDKVLVPLFEELAITACADSDHTHNKMTRRSITGLIISVGRTPVMYQSKQQGTVETSTYGAEFMAMKTAVEEVMDERYMLHCLGVK
eukprot:8209964-Ditylum_brightwellii.AAC.1